MAWWKWLGIGAVGLLAAAGIALGVVYLVTGPEPPPEGSASAGLLEPGGYRVGETELILVDGSRGTPGNGTYPGADDRTLTLSLWYPEGEVAGDSPLVVYSHGFMSNRSEGDYIARALASRGYVVAAPDFPLSSMGAPGGPNAADVVSQPGDVSFIIDSLLALDDAQRPFPGPVDGARIGVAGLSLGGLTSTLVGYHPRWRDERVRAVISIAGPAAMFTRRFFLNSQAPFLMIAGTGDAIVDYQTHAAGIPDRVTQGTLLSIEDGSHVAFASLAEPSMRFMDHPDSLGCDSLTANTGASGEGDAAAENPFAGLGDLSDGINPDATRLEICTRELGTALHPGRQQMITQVAVVSFFESYFAATPEARRAAREHLHEGIAVDFREATVN